MKAWANPVYSQAWIKLIKCGSFFDIKGLLCLLLPLNRFKKCKPAIAMLYRLLFSELSSSLPPSLFLFLFSSLSLSPPIFYYSYLCPSLVNLLITPSLYLFGNSLQRRIWVFETQKHWKQTFINIASFHQKSKSTELFSIIDVFFSIYFDFRFFYLWKQN